MALARLTGRGVDRFDQSFEDGSQFVQFLEVSDGQSFEHPATLPREYNAHDATIVGVAAAFYEPGVFGPVDQLDGAVMSQQQCIADAPDGGAVDVLAAADHQQQLMLSRRETGFLGLFLAPMQEAPQPEPEGEEALEVPIGEFH